MPGRGKTGVEEIIAGKMGWGVGYWHPNSQKEKKAVLVRGQGGG